MKRFLLCLTVAALSALPAPALPNFTGSWKMNASKSDFGAMPAPSSSTSDVKHDEPSLAVHNKQSSDMGDFETDAKYTTDGKECTNKFMDSEMKSSVKWDGDALIIESKGSFGGNDFTMKARWTLSSDGKTLTMAQHFSSSMGDMDMKIIMDKQ